MLIVNIYQLHEQRKLNIRTSPQALIALQNDMASLQLTNCAIPEKQTKSENTQSGSGSLYV